MVCLRDRKSGRILGLSYTEEGLKWTANKSGRLLYFNGAVLKPSLQGVVVVGDTSPSSKVVVEPYVRKRHKNSFENNFEEFWACKARHMATYY